MNPVTEKYSILKEVIGGYGSVLVAFSGGCDSALVAKVARDVLGRNKMRAVTSWSDSFPQAEVKEVNLFVERYDIPHNWIETREMSNVLYTNNPVNRCYYCKTELYDFLMPVAQTWALQVIANGTQSDDLSDRRPGLDAAKEKMVRSPLLEADLNKEEVRLMARMLELPTWNKPAAACLSSRIPHGQKVTAGKLRQIDEGEAILKAAGFRVVRLRHFGNHAHIEVAREEIPRFSEEPGLRHEIFSKIQALGFESVAIDPEGYRQGKLHTAEISSANRL